MALTPLAKILGKNGGCYRKRLEKDGFKVETKTISSSGSVAYEISKKEGFPSGNEI